ncbi:unnamed protein product [Callosobruchus maculatus]|uniref:ABC-2 type transporter transmembrane domain-containing protein n=1 Tax=Callosobruchus maculatus TaxID=64391 RepID=A0A653D748_CALMS|nr:unnamed protein product [Callosobruchus maculatus]
MVGQTVLALVFMIVIFKVQCCGSLVLVVVLTLLQGLCGMCIGFFISAICSDESSAIQMALGSFYPTILLSGVIWPIESMPLYLRYVAIVLPLTLATSAMRSIMLRGWEIYWPEVYWGYVATCSWIVFLLTASLLIIRFKEH